MRILADTATLPNKAIGHVDDFYSQPSFTSRFKFNALIYKEIFLWHISCSTKCTINFKKYLLTAMKTLKLACSALTLMLSVAFAGPALATSVIPLSYTFDQPTSCGSWCYHDPAFTKLTDGVVGLAGWAVNAGQEWDGWLYKPVVNIDFDFGSAMHIGSIKIGTTQDNLSDVVLPSFDLYKKVAGNWVLEGAVNIPPSSANNASPNSTAPHRWVTFDNLDIDSQFLRVTVHSNGPWTFVDEVQFDGAVVPEPGTYAILLLGLSLMGLTAGKRKK